MPLHLPDQRIIVTGGAGFLGSAIVRTLLSRGVASERIVTVRSSEFDLTRADAASALLHQSFGGVGPTLILHAAGFVGGIGANRRHPARFFHDNMSMALHLVEGLRRNGLIAAGCRFVQVGTMCSYPTDATVPYQEDALWKGYPDEVSSAYGVAKLAAWTLLDAYGREHGLKSAYVIPVNLYGPGDNIADPENSHVAGALVRKFVEAAAANAPEVVCWGSGLPTRDFLYVEDAAEGVVRAAEVMERPIPINLASGRETSIRELAEIIAHHAGFAGRVMWDRSKPDGQARRSLDIGRAADVLGWRPRMALEEGLGRTVKWYRAANRK